MEFEITPILLLIMASVAFLAGFIDAIAGGGGLLTLPALLTAGLPPHLVLGTNKLCATFGSATASFTFYRRRLFAPRLWWRGLLATAIGAAIGAVVAHWMPAEWLNRLLPVIVLLCGGYMLFARLPDADEQAEQQPVGKHRQWPQGLGLGFYDGVAGPGTGAFWTVSNLLLYPLDLIRASAVARSMNFISNGVALGVFIIGGQVAWLLGLIMGATMMLGAFLGAHTAISGGSRLIRPLFILVVMGLTIRLVWQNWL